MQERSIPYEVYFSEKRGDVRQLAKRLTNVSEGAERFLIVLGGDGTLNEAIQGDAAFQNRFGSVISRPVRVTIWRGILRLGTTLGL